MINLRPLHAVGLAVLAMTMVACTSAASTVGPTPPGGVRPTTSPAAMPPAGTSPTQQESTPPAPVLKRVGISLPLSQLAGFIDSTGSVPNQLSIYQQWSTHEPFDAVAASVAKSRGMTILVNWEPWAPECNCPDQPDWSDLTIAHGAQDSYIRAYAHSVDAFTRTGGQVTLRLAHEMNGNWYPWAAAANGNTAAAYIAMWRHVHTIFTAEHVPNVRWMWSPNLTYPGSSPMATLYPGDQYVDDVGLSGYNFGTGHGFRWTKFSELYQPSLDALRKVAPHKPLYLAEIGCATKGGNKAEWIVDMFRQVKNRPYITGLTWFEQRTQRNWLVEDTPADVRAWQTGVALLQRP